MRASWGQAVGTHATAVQRLFATIDERDRQHAALLIEMADMERRAVEMEDALFDMESEKNEIEYEANSSLAALVKMGRRAVRVEGALAALTSAAIAYAGWHDADPGNDYDAAGDAIYDAISDAQSVIDEATAPNSTAGDAAPVETGPSASGPCAQVESPSALDNAEAADVAVRECLKKLGGAS